MGWILHKKKPEWVNFPVQPPQGYKAAWAWYAEPQPTGRFQGGPARLHHLNVFKQLRMHQHHAQQTKPGNILLG